MISEGISKADFKKYRREEQKKELKAMRKQRSEHSDRRANKSRRMRKEFASFQTDGPPRKSIRQNALNQSTEQKKDRLKFVNYICPVNKRIVDNERRTVNKDGKSLLFRQPSTNQQTAAKRRQYLT